MLRHFLAIHGLNLQKDSVFIACRYALLFRVLVALQVPVLHQVKCSLSINIQF